MEKFLAQKVFAEMPMSIFSPSSHFLLYQHRLVSVTPCHFHSFSRQTQIQKHIIRAANKRSHNGFARSGKIVQSAYYIASKLKILPEPLDLLIQEFGVGGGNRGGFFGSRKGSGWGGFDGWGRRRNKRNLGFLGILVVSGLGLWFILGKRSDSVLFSGSFGLVLLGLSMEGWRRGLKDWALGFCCCAFLVSLALKKEDFQKLVGSVLKMKDSQKWAKSFAAMQCGRRRK